MAVLIVLQCGHRQGLKALALSCPVAQQCARNLTNCWINRFLNKSLPTTIIVNRYVTLLCVLLQFISNDSLSLLSKLTGKNLKS